MRASRRLYARRRLYASRHYRERHVRAAPAEGDEGGIEAHGYSLMPVIEIPSMNIRWPKKNRVTIGMTTIVLTAIRYG